MTFRSTASSKTKRWVWRALLVSLLLPIAQVGSVHGQDFRATIVGQVTDHQKAAVVGAVVRAIRVDTNLVIEVKTNSEGYYSIPYLVPGAYNLEISAAGFATLKREHIVVQVADKLNVSASLQVGGVSEAVTVQGGQDLIHTETASRGMNYDANKTQELPLNGRQVYMLLSLTPGVIFTQETFGPTGFSGTRGWDVNNAYKINGARGGQNLFLLNGAPISDQNGTWQVAPNVEAIQEFKVMTNTYDAGFGRFGGGVVNTTLRSGTNDWHGSLFDYFRNRIFDANYFQNNFRGAPKDKHNQHQFGGAAGGPIRKDKDFLFVSFEGWRERIGFPALSSTPPVSLRDGQHFNDLGYKIYDPRTTHICGSREPSSTCQGQTFIRDPFPNNVIPANRISPIGKAILSYFPSPNAPGLSNNFIGSGNVGRYRYEQPVVRWDHTFGPNDKLNAVFTYQWGTEYRDSTGFGKPAGSGDVGSKRVNHNYILDWTHVISSTMVLDVRGSYGRFTSFFPRYTDFDLTADSIGMTQMIHAPTVEKNTVPQVSVGGYTTLFALAGAGTVFSSNAFNQWNLTPSLTMTRGTHSIKTGFELNYVAAGAVSPGWANGTFTFGKGLTQQFPSRDQGELDGSGVASLLVGAPTAGGIDVNDSAYRSRPYYALYVQDDWKVASKLTLNLGLRWDVQVPWLERFNRATRGFDLATKNPLSDQILANWASIKQTYDAANPNAKFKYPAPPSVLTGGYLFPSEGGQPRRLYDTDWKNIAPRFGLAWRFADKTVLRLGAGVFYQSPTQNGVVTGFNQRTNYNTSLDGLTPSAGLTGPYSLVNPFPDGLAPAIRSSLGLLTNVGNGVSFDPPGFKIPRTYQYSFGFEHELPSGIVAEVSFAGNYQIFATTGFNLNGLRLEDFNAGRLDNSYLNRNLPNPFFGILPRTAGFGANATIAATNLLTPNPIFGGITNNLLQDGHYRSDALQVRIEKRAFGTRGSGVMTWGLSYTFAKAYEQNHRLNNFNALEPNIYEIDNTDKPHTFSFHGVWELPVGTNRRVKIGNPVANGVLGDWSFDWIFSYSSGYPVGWPNFENTCGSWHTTRQTELRWLNNDRTCYKQLPNFTLRTQLDRFSDLREPAATQLNLALAKVFVFTERYRLQFKSEAFNVTNTPIRPGPDTNPTSTTFGQLPKSQKNFPRVIQLALKFYF